MATYSTLEEIKTGMQDDLFADDLITLRSEQRDAIDQAKERFCKEVEDVVNTSMKLFQNIDSSSGTPRCVSARPSVPCSSCENWM